MVVVQASAGTSVENASMPVRRVNCTITCFNEIDGNVEVMIDVRQLLFPATHQLLLVCPLAQPLFPALHLGRPANSSTSIRCRLMVGLLCGVVVSAEVFVLGSA